MSEENKCNCELCKLYALRKEALESDDIELVKETLKTFADHFLNADFDRSYYMCILDGSLPQAEKILTKSLEKNRRKRNEVNMSFDAECGCNNCVNHQKPEPKEEPTPSSGNLDVDWNNLCAEILMGKAKEVDLKRITKEMLDAGRQKEMGKEFARIGKLLKGN